MLIIKTAGSAGLQAIDLLTLFLKRMEFLKDLWLFLKERKKWWLTPIIIALLLIAVLIIAANTGLAPFIYTLF